MAIFPLKAPFIICLCLFFFFPTPVTSSNNQTDFLALLAFKKAIDTDPYGALSSWNDTLHFCNWQGILCSQRHQNRVASINLMSHGLFGSLSPHLGNLSFLRSINIQNNSFHGLIPDQIGRLRRLQLIDFSNNSLSDQIPRNLSQCMNIYSLNFIDNILTGPIIPELSSLSRLERLGLGSNQFSGSIPPSFGNLTNLIVLSLRSCGAQGEIPGSFVKLVSLRFLIMDDNHLTGSIPSGMFNISTISSFLLRSNQLQGTIPSEINFPRLRYIDLRYNLLHGVIPVSLSNFSFLEEIDLSVNNFSGPIAIDFSRLSSLQHLFLQSNSLVGDLSFISSMANCTSLTLLSLVDNLFSGPLPVSIGNLSDQLSFVYLGGNMLHGSIPSSIGNLIGLTFLAMDYNTLEGPIPSSIGKLNNLQVIYLGGNRLTGMPFSFSNLTRFIHLHLQENDLSGNIPIFISNFTSLLSLDLSQNNINGSIPREILSFATNLVSLDISNNAIAGSIPLEVGSLINLGEVFLYDNKLSGPIPNTLSRCIRLERIEMQNNSLTGEVPDGLRSLRGVEYLDLSLNKLTGSIPRFLGEMDLTYLNLSFNRFQGEVPALGVFLNESVVSLEGNNDLCGAIPYLNLHQCSSPSSRKHHMSKLSKILISVASGVFCISLVSCFVYVFYYRKRVSKNTQSLVPSLEANILRLSYGDLLKATDEFSEANLLGAGRYGTVYKGIVGGEDQFPVAVKVLNLDTKGASKSFMSECNALRGIRHRNLVKIVSVCSSTDFQGNDFKALIYEFKTNGNLDGWLHHELGEPKNISLMQRLNIAIDIANALNYLHCGTDSTIVHGDVKPSNILLDEKMTAYVADFGLAKIIPNTYSTQESSSSGIKGTIGYIPPEYGMSGMVSSEGDVYSYGILLLEMFTGRGPTDDTFMGYSSLRDMVERSLRGQVMDIIDPIIVSEHEQKMDPAILRCIVCVLEIGVACSNDLPGDRIEMSDVVDRLTKSVHVIG